MYKEIKYIIDKIHKELGERESLLSSLDNRTLYLLKPYYPLAITTLKSLRDKEGEVLIFLNSLREILHDEISKKKKGSVPDIF
jgi:hypothetical protein